MKKIILILAILALSGCIGNQERVLKAADNSTLTLYPNGQLNIYFSGSGMSYGGVYSMQGDKILITYSGLALSNVLTPKNGGYVDNEGEFWK